jgi:hypothetical protein
LSFNQQEAQSAVLVDLCFLKERIMFTLRKNVMNLFVDRYSQQWIVLDPGGDFWIVRSDDANPWDQRQPFTPTEETELEPVPGHYKYMLGLPT